MPATRSGRRAATPRASIPPRLWPTICTREPRRCAIASSRASSWAAAARRAADVGADVRAVGAEALTAQRLRHQAQRAVAGEEAGHEQHGLARPRRGAERRTASGGAGRWRSQRPARSDRPRRTTSPRAARQRPRAARSPPGSRKSAIVRWVTVIEPSPEPCPGAGYRPLCAHRCGTRRVDWWPWLGTPRPLVDHRIGPTAPSRVEVSEELVRAGRQRRRALLPDLRRPRRRAAAAGDGSRRPDDLVGSRALPHAGAAAASS